MYVYSVKIASYRDKCEMGKEKKRNHKKDVRQEKSM